jgi:cobalt/nickel transport system permease protein
MSRRIRLSAFIAAGLVVALAVAFFVSRAASSQPDGLNRVAIDNGLEQATKPSAVDGRAGVLGVTVTFALASGVFVVVRRRNRG